MVQFVHGQVGSGHCPVSQSISVGSVLSMDPLLGSVPVCLAARWLGALVTATASGTERPSLSSLVPHPPLQEVALPALALPAVNWMGGHQTLDLEDSEWG